MNLVFFGAGAFGIPSLARLASSHTLSAIVTQPDRPAGRRQAVTPTPIAAWAAEHAPRVPIHKPENVNQPAVLDSIRALPAEAWVVIAFGQKLSPALLAGRFAINLHASLLPRWRGAAPINHAILAGDTVTGNSVITLADRMDAGLILGQSRREIDPLTTAGELHDLLAEDGPDLLEKVLADHAANQLSPLTQEESEVTLAPKLRKSDGWIDFCDTAESARRRVHALTPWPGVSVAFRDQPLKILRVQPTSADREQDPGVIINASEGTVMCANHTALKLLEVQPAGGKAMNWSAFANGRRVESGERLIGGAPPC